MGKALNDLAEHYAELIDALTDTTAQFEAIEHLEVWKAARAASASLGAGTLSQYSIAGRTFTKRTLKELQDFARSELQEVLSILGIAGGGSALIDLSGGRAYGVGT